MNIIPLGNKIIVRRIEDKITKHGIIMKEKGESNGNAWGVIVSLPEATENIWIKTLKIGDKILYKRFQADNSVNSESEDDFCIVDMESNSGERAGQVLAVEHK